MPLRRLRLALEPLFAKQRVERELDEELNFHLDMETAERERRGMAPGEARRAALASFGGMEKTKEEVREASPARFVESLVHDLRFGARTLRRYPGYAAAAVLTLGLGIGANTAVFSAVDAVLLRPLPYGGGDRLVVLRQSDPTAGVEDTGLSVPEVLDYRQRSRSLDGIAEYHSMYFNLLGHGDPLRVQTGVVSSNFFGLLGIQPFMGRTFTPADEQLGAEPVLILAHDFWRDKQGSDPNIVGRTFEMNDRVHTVVGVLPPVPQYPDDNDVYMPTSACPFRSNPRTIEARAGRGYLTFGRLRDGVSLAKGKSDVAAVAAQLAREYPEAYTTPQGLAADLLPLREELVREARPTLLILLGTVALVLLTVCANVANLSLARLLRRQGELSVRAALGAGRGRLVSQLLAESAVLALAGGALGLLLAFAFHRMLIAFAGRFTPRAEEIQMDGRVLLFTFAVAALTGLVCGSVPALSRRISAAGLREAGTRTTSGGRGQRVLIAAQLAASFVLLIGAGLMTRSLLELQGVDPGFDPGQVLTATVDLDWHTYTTPAKAAAFADELLRDVRNQSGVVSAGLASAFPLDDSGPIALSVEIEGRPRQPGEPAPQIDYRAVSPGYFETLRVPLLAGRTFNDGDHAEAQSVAVVSGSMVRHLWRQGDPLGTRITLDNGRNWLTIVGVVGDARQYGLDREAGDEVYAPIAQRPSLGFSVLARTQGDPLLLGPTVRDLVRSIDPRQPVAAVDTLESLRAESLASPRLTAALVGLFAALALAITATGLAGVIAYAVNQRTHEIGIRMALGAQRTGVLWMVLRQAAVLVMVGLPLGLAGALALNRLFAGLLFAVQPTDPPTYLAVSLLLVGVAAIACLLPARRATAIDPLTALRSE